MRGLALLLSLALGLLAGCGPADAEMIGDVGAPEASGKPTVGQYELRGVRYDYHASVIGLANGFPIVHYRVPGMARVGSDLGFYLTPALVSGRNTAGYGGAPFVRRSGREVYAGAVRFEMWVQGPDGREVPGTRRGVASSDSAFAAWEAELQARWPAWLAMEDSLFAADPAQADAVSAELEASAEAAFVGRGPALRAAWAWSQANPVIVQTSFVRPPENSAPKASGGSSASGARGPGARSSDGQPSFDEVFREAPVIGGTPADSARLRDYAVRLREFMVVRDTAAAWDAFSFALMREYEAGGGARGVGMDSVAYASEAREYLVMEELDPFEAEDVELRSWSGGRVWELYRDGARGLLQEGGGIFRPIFVGEGPGGELQVVWANL